MSGKSPAFQFYAAEYLADENVQLMTLEEEGCYIRMLAYCWREGSIPADHKLLSRLCKNAPEEILTSVERRFEKHGTRLEHARLNVERKKQTKFNKKQRLAGIASGKARRKKKLVKEPVFNQRSSFVGTKMNSSSSSSSSSSGSFPNSTFMQKLGISLSLFQQYKTMREKIHRPIVAGAEDLVFSELAKLQDQGQNPVEILQDAIRTSSYNFNPNGKGKLNGPESFQERTQRKSQEEIADMRRNLDPVVREVERGLPKPSGK